MVAHSHMLAGDFRMDVDSVPHHRRHPVAAEASVVTHHSPDRP